MGFCNSTNSKQRGNIANNNILNQNKTDNKNEINGNESIKI